MERLEDLKPLVCSVKNCKNVPIVEIGIIDEKLKNLCFKHWKALVKRWLKEVKPL
jgi:hypothetical protein